ncbi:hypothetical protein [Streptomyces sp. NPDC049879]|uniref:hypothetical protein n=1 Tax=Streptomyces sp. NPDC049879 TaxID=3365598 RepID=UPI00379D6492
MAEDLIASAAYDTDWHVFVDPPEGPLGYCTGVGPDEDFDPAAASRVLGRDGWEVTGEWVETPPGEPWYAYQAPVRRAPAPAA